jgi:hypothetical protein
MIISILSFLMSAVGAAPATVSATYQISVMGPAIELETSCQDPCQLDEHKVIGRAGGQLSSEETIVRNGNDPLEDGVKCKGDCSGSSKKATKMVFQPQRDLREGIEISIKEGGAHFIFYSVVETEEGPATRRQHSEFRIDRPLLEVELHDHAVVITTVSEKFK